jgi:nucleoid-associated protein YgaU
LQEVRIVAKSPRIDIIVPMGDGPAVVTGGLGGWQAVERIDDIAFTTWEGQEPLTQDLPLLLDGNGRTPRSVQAELNTLLQLGRSFNHKERSAPPVFKVWGPMQFGEGKNWVLGDGGIELGTDDTWRLDDGTLIRQSLVLHLIEFVNPQVIRRKGSKIALGPGKVVPGGGASLLFPNEVVGGTYTTKVGDTLSSIAAKLYDGWEAWEPIARKNDLTDPNRKLPVGTKLILP